MVFLYKITSHRVPKISLEVIGNTITITKGRSINVCIVHKKNGEEPRLTLFLSANYFESVIASGDSAGLSLMEEFLHNKTF